MTQDQENIWAEQNKIYDVYEHFFKGNALLRKDTNDSTICEDESSRVF